MTAPSDTMAAGFAYAMVEEISPLVRRVTARNPSPLTFTGTGTYIVGRGRVAVLDPGPAIPEHLTALLAALAGETVSHVILTHRHVDHATMAREFADTVGAPITALPIRNPNAASSVPVVEDLSLADGDVVSGAGWDLEAIHTPGHASDHLCFALAQEATIFSGDHVMGWTSTAIVPPDGDMLDYETSLEKLARRPELLYRPTHGQPVRDGPALARALLAHRQGREASIVALLSDGPLTLAGLVARIYPGLDPPLVPMAGLTLRAHIIKLEKLGRVASEGDRFVLDGKA